jgi:surfeit locus 1 family protein
VLGTGFWVLTPMRTGDGWILVNRGFVPYAMHTQVPRGPEQQSLVGLLRFSEPGGAFLQPNRPAEGRWTSRDVAAIAAAEHLQGPVAPFFVDAQATPATGDATWPRPGLTVVRFRNEHLAYALTWFALAAMVAAAIGYLVVHERRLRRAGRPHAPDDRLR